MKLVAPGIVQGDNGLPYFGGSIIFNKLRASGWTFDEAAAFVGALVSQAIEAEARGRGSVQRVNTSEPT